MNSSDDSTDKALKERFQRVFNDFERTPSRSLKKRIWNQLPAAPTTRSRYVVLSILLLLLIGGVYGPQRILPRPTSHAQPNRLARGQRYAGSSQAQRRPAIHANQAVSGSDNLMTNQPDSSSTQSTLQKEVKPANLALDTKSAMPRQSVHLESRVARLRPASNQVRLFPAVSQANKPVDRGPIFRTEKQTAGTNSSISTSVRASFESATSDSVFGQEALLVSLQPVAICPLRVPDYSITRQVTQLPQQPPKEAAESPRAPLHWLVSMSPLSTFQLMTIVTKPETYVQQVDTPGGFSAATWGYQVSGGLVWRQLAVQLMAGQLRRWAYYDVATNEYRIESTGPNEYRITRLGRSVAENSSLTMLGASLAKEYSLSKRPGRYAARLGGQGTYLPATGQTLLWGQAALTMGIPLKTAYSIQVGPTVQYGFSRLFSGDRQLIIHPFLIGASFTIRPAAR